MIYLSIARYNWTHKKWCRPSDPINIVFEEITLDEIEKFLLGRDWKAVGAPLAFSQVIPYPNPLQKREQEKQFIGPGKFCMIRRCHIRLWRIEKRIIAGVHHDALRVSGHTTTDFESIEKFFAEECANNPDWEILEDYVDMDNRISGYGQPYNNGRATLIRRKKS